MVYISDVAGGVWSYWWQFYANPTHSSRQFSARPLSRPPFPLPSMHCNDLNVTSVIKYLFSISIWSSCCLLHSHLCTKLAHCNALSYGGGEKAERGACREGTCLLIFCGAWECKELLLELQQLGSVLPPPMFCSRFRSGLVWLQWKLDSH